MGTKLAAAGLAAIIGIGGVAVATNPLTAASAQEAPDTGTGSSAPAPDGPLARALDALVSDGTLTQAQADAVQAKTKAEAEAGRADRKAQRRARRAAIVEVAAKAIGSTPEDVEAGIGAGTSIADQAKAKGVDRQVVDDALTKQLTAAIDAAVEDGKLTEERAAKAKDHVDRAVDRILDADGSGAGRRGLRGRIAEHRGN